MFDYILLSLKGLSRKKLRSALVIILIFTGVFLLNVYAMMTNCIVDMEQIKAQDNIEYKRITIIPYNGVIMEKNGISLYDLRDIKDIPNVASVSLNNTEFEPNDKYELTINAISINGTHFDRFFNSVNGDEADFPIFPLFDAFDPYNLSKEQLIQKTDPVFSALLCGQWPIASAENEVALDSITAARFFSLDYSGSIDYSSVCGGRLTVETTNGEEIACIITGVYDYRILMDYKTTKSLEEMEFEQNYVRFRYTADELENRSFFANNICFPLMINETLASKVYKAIDGGISNKPPVFEFFYGTVDVMVDSIDNAESVVDMLEKYGYLVSSQIDLAKNAVQRFFFYKETILLVGVTISVITIIQLLSVMAMIVNERKKYMVMLSRIGFRKINIAHIITGEMIWIGLIGSLLGLFGCFISKFVFESLIEHGLAESGLYKYISLGVTPVMVFTTLAICVVLCYIIGMATSILTLKNKTIKEKSAK